MELEQQVTGRDGSDGVLSRVLVFPRCTDVGENILFNLARQC